MSGKYVVTVLGNNWRHSDCKVILPVCSGGHIPVGVIFEVLIVEANGDTILKIDGNHNWWVARRELKELNA